jgi:nudix motif 8
MRFGPAFRERVRGSLVSLPPPPALYTAKLPKSKRDADYQRRMQRQAAVLIPLCTVHGVPSVLFQIRGMDVGTHKGQVSFPGGHCEADESASTAALREFEEEMGTSTDCVDVLGSFHDVRAITGTIVTPVVAFLKNDIADGSSFTPNSDEVSSVFTLSVEQLLDEALREQQELGFRGAMFPRFNGGPAPVWGLTAFLMEEVMQKVLLPSASADDEK